MGRWETGDAMGDVMGDVMGKKRIERGKDHLQTKRVGPKCRVDETPRGRPNARIAGRPNAPIAGRPNARIPESRAEAQGPKAQVSLSPPRWPKSPKSRAPTETREAEMCQCGHRKRKRAPGSKIAASSPGWGPIGIRSPRGPAQKRSGKRQADSSRPTQHNRARRPCLRRDRGRDPLSSRRNGRTEHHRSDSDDHVLSCDLFPGPSPSYLNPQSDTEGRFLTFLRRSSFDASAAYDVVPWRSYTPEARPSTQPASSRAWSLEKVEPATRRPKTGTGPEDEAGEGGRPS
ncbi:hypothetical protein BJ875DRAFT_438471 [Amylocarpus encephaloides]|uniref:Uncharacterized protein n=1 Tax=Amylocarpus encephaloides TaxID=45428 RepID=A0A9P7YPM0_9HELO|nr:hypothetical protein BJ875DRAFT_438471 [Amylocarpus encephaloides]